MYEVRLRALEGHSDLSAQKALQGSETETMELLGGTKENNVLSDVCTKKDRK